MTKHSRKIAGFCVALALSAGLALPAMAEDPTADTVLATVNGVGITLGDIIVTRDGLPDQYKSLPDDVLFKGILDQLVQQEALMQTLGEKLTKKDTLAIADQRRNYLSNVALSAGIADAVSEDAIQKAYDAKYKAATPALEYHAAHILVDDEAKAKALLKEIQDGASFADVAKANSKDGSAASGGDLGWFGLGAMVKPFEDAVVAAKVGEVTGPIKTDFGWHLILVSETRNAAAPALAEVHDELGQQLQKDAIAAFIKTVTDKAQITRTEEGVDPALIKDTTLLDK
ncbi:MAG: peptidylprolyl isomerase [bacterium]